MRLFVIYCRVSTTKQGMSGLGLEAQQQAVSRYVTSTGGEIAKTYVEVESGASRKRPQLQSALAHCRRAKATLLIAKLDRLARNVAFISSLMEAGVDFVAVDAPYANKLMLHILAAFAEHEREQISLRTQAALAAAKARGVKLGSHGTALAEANRQLANRRAVQLEQVFAEAEKAGHKTLSSIATFFNRNDVPSATGGKWHPTTVARVRQRLQSTRAERARLPVGAK